VLDGPPFLIEAINRNGKMEKSLGVLDRVSKRKNGGLMSVEYPP